MHEVTWAEVPATAQVRLKGQPWRVISPMTAGVVTLEHATSGRLVTSQPGQLKPSALVTLLHPGDAAYAPSPAEQAATAYVESCSPEGQIQLATALAQIHLGGSIIATRVSEDAPFECPITPTAAHLYLFHRDVPDLATLPDDPAERAVALDVLHARHEPSKEHEHR